MYKMDIKVKGNEFFVEKILKIPYKKKTNSYKTKISAYKHCLINNEELGNIKKIIKANQSIILECIIKKVKIKNLYYLYSDGASINNGKKSADLPMYGSYGYIITKKINEENYRLLENCTKSNEGWTNNYSELLGVISGLKRFKDICSGKSYVIVVTDSQYVSLGSTSWIHNWKKNGMKNNTGDEVSNKSLWEDYIKLESELKKNKIMIRFKWVKGHTDATGLDALMNAECDNLATLSLNKYRSKSEKEFRQLSYSCISGNKIVSTNMKNI